MDASEEWELHERGHEVEAGLARFETYFHAGTSDPELAQRLHDEGLIYAVNRLVLHPLGMALGVEVADLDRETMRGTVKHLTLQAWPDAPASYGDAEATHERNLAKLREAGHLERAPVLADLLRGA